MPNTIKNIKFRHTEHDKTLAKKKKIKTNLKQTQKKRSQIINEKRDIKNIQQSSAMDVVDESQSPPKNSIDIVTKGIGNISLGKENTIEISLIIIGHGGVISAENGIPHFFKLPENVSQTNVLGLRYAGLTNLVNKAYKEYIDNELQHEEVLKNAKKLKLFLKYYNYAYSFFLNEYEKDKNGDYILDIFGNKIYKFPKIRLANALVNNALSKRNIHLHGDYAGIRYNYDSTRVQKLYTGKNKNESSIFSHHQEIYERPLVKIFSVNVNGEEIQRNKGLPEMIVTDITNGVTLTEVIEKAVEKTMQVFRNLSTIQDKKIIVNVIDMTCNDYTNKFYSVVEFIGRPKKSGVPSIHLH
jgi:hypothetical protein